MVDYYMADENLDWDNTLKIGRAPANPMKLGAADLFAGFLLKLYEKHGGLDYVSRLWHEVGRRPKADDIQDAVDNLIVSASIAAGENLSEQFSEWRWPVSDAARTEIDRLLDIQSPDSRDVGGSRIWTERSRIDENRYGQNRKTELSEIGGSDQCGNRD